MGCWLRRAGRAAGAEAETAGGLPRERRRGTAAAGSGAGLRSRETWSVPACSEHGRGEKRLFADGGAGRTPGVREREDPGMTQVWA